MGHHHFLERGHLFRLQRFHFNRKIEQWEPPLILSGSDILKQMEGLISILEKQPSQIISTKELKKKLLLKMKQDNGEIEASFMD